MMYSTNVQLVKWTFPAVALIIGLFWYKRRRIDRADPGGTVESNSQDNMSTSYMKEAISNLYDSTNEKTDESFSTGSCTQQEELTRAPRKVSESMDIPNRKSVPQSCDSSQISTEVEPTTDIQLGSNPTTSYFETIVKKRNTSSFDLELTDITRVFEDSTEEEQCNVQNQVESSEQNDTAAEFTHKTNKQLAEEHHEDAIATAGQAVYERDSANHSPISGVLEGSIIDEARSEEGSTDSGKGGSINGCRKTNAVEQTTYDFAIPQLLVGRLIGRHGSFLHNIRTKAEVQIYVNDHPGASDQKICSIEGNAEGINTALDLIRKKFPEKRFPEVTLAEISTPEIMTVDTSWVPQCSYLFLAEGVNNDITVSHIVKPNWLFVQFPTHPTFPSLRLLDLEMTYAYNTMESSVPSVLTRGLVYVANWLDMWVRVCMEKPDPLGEKHKMRLLDHGGYYEFSSSQIREIRLEFLQLPFQAIEIFLAHIQPKNGVWLSDAYDVIAQVCFGVVGQAQVEGYVDSNVYTNIYYNVPKYGVISLADELIARGFANSANPEDIVPETSLELFEESVYS